MNLHNKTVLITGASRGIGQATAIELAKAGANIFGVDLQLDELQETAEAVAKKGRMFKSFACDVSDEATVRELIAGIIEKHGGFDVLINNAGVAPSGPFMERDFSVWRRTLEVNLTAVLILTHAALPHLLTRERSHIVNLASVAGKFGTEGLAAYGASKHGVVGFSSALRAELAGTNIGVSWICPSYVNTRMIEAVKRTFWTPLAQPEEVARAIRKAIEKNLSEVFVPKIMHLTVGIMPNLLPNAWRALSKWTKASQGWLTARKELVA